MPSPTEPVSELRKIKIVESGEPLVDFRDECPGVLFDAPFFDYRREALVRKSLAERLRRASESLPDGYRLTVLEGWRPPHIQRRMYADTWARFQKRHPDWSDIKLRRVVNRFTAPPDGRVPPPHSTGGAVDLAVAGPDGKKLDFRSPYGLFDPAGAPFDAPGLSDDARRNRRLMAAALLAQGVTNYPSEWWHWSFGDQGWAYRGGHSHAIYGPTTPAGYEPDPRDLAEAPLAFVGVDW